VIAIGAPDIRFVIGIDGGGTATRARLTYASGALLANAEAGPSALGQGVDQAWTNVLCAIDLAFEAARLRDWRYDECAVGLGLAGAIVETHRQKFLDVARRFSRLALASDGFTALLGAHRGGPGVVVAAGTGSIGEALLADGAHVSIGGWGYPVGDEGSGAWLGMHAMRHAQQVVDRRTAAGPLARAIHAAAGSTRDALLSWCERAGQNAYAALAPFVFETERSDPFSAELLDRAARALDDLATTLDPAGDLPLVVSGSIGVRLHPRLAPRVRARLVEPHGDPLDGALQLIRRELDAR